MLVMPLADSAPGRVAWLELMAGWVFGSRTTRLPSGAPTYALTRQRQVDVSKNFGDVEILGPTRRFDPSAASPDLPRVRTERDVRSRGHEL